MNKLFRSMAMRWSKEIHITYKLIYQFMYTFVLILYQKTETNLSSYQKNIYSKCNLLQFFKDLSSTIRSNKKLNVKHYQKFEKR